MSDEGRLIAGRYRLYQQIGSGAMGVVWRAVDERLQRTVAVKQLLLQAGQTDAETEEARERSMREGRIAARLQHQNAIAIFDVAEDEGQPVLVMEYLPSESLASMISERGVLPPLEVARIGAQVAGALSAAHMAGIVHRDLKPGNILLGDNGQAKITDFGISRAIGDVAVTQSGILAGTPAYLSPEVALGRDPAPASDVFSLGSTLYAAIEGHPPFGVDENAISLLHRVSRGQVEPPRQGGPMTVALMQLLRPDPVERPTMAQAQVILQAVAEGRPIPNSTGGRQSTPAPAPAPPAAPGPAVSAAHGAPASQGSGGTRLDQTSGGNPPVQLGDSASADSTGSTKARQRIVWVVAVAAAILIGVLVANAFGSVGANRSSAQQPSLPAAAPTTVAPAPTSAPEPPATTGPRTTAPPSSSAAPSSTESSAPTRSSTKKVPGKKLEAAVKKYFSLVPDKLDKSWAMLGPEMQQMGKDEYEDWWNSVKDVKIVEKPKALGNKVLVTLRYKMDEEEKTTTEKHLLGMIVENGKPLINSDNRL
ncbi:serine/threonine-protein kinase [Haloactinomyces albus]|uniref:non-specific serine/threonine protein kinase n=1 Tax=Haloactinomyces albus TaxID=1352928 RepID=A0AAE3ZFF5_9ACTN|nr:serine/threonine-protein kinase [Haloactinomyces albus]MDR7302569.1 serine/threonine protein kinase [Haloactinomyces albus]